jgi:hypothetical protein
MSIWDNIDENKNFLSNLALFLLTISIIGCILAILDFHLDLSNKSNTFFSNTNEWNNFLYAYNWMVVIGNSAYIILSIHRYFKFTQLKNQKILKESLSFRGIKSPSHRTDLV